MNRFHPRTLVRRHSLRVGLPIAFCLAALAISVSMASTAPAGPVGLTAIASDGSVGLGWQPVSGATGYRVYRSATLGGARTLLTAQPIAATSFTDATAANGQAAYYVVTAVDGAGESPLSNAAGATPRARTCSSGNAIVTENCFPGTTAWKTQNPLQASNGGIEGFATATSVAAGGSVDLKIRTTADNAPFHIEVYRSGYYGGTNGRLISTLPGLLSSSQPACQYDATTGLRDCSTWSTAATITTTPDWPSGVYLLRIVRDDNGDDNHILLVVRHDGDHAAIVYGVPTSTYQSYNSYGGKSLYDFNSTGDLTVSGTTRAVAVSYDRPYQQSVNGMADWYPNVDVRNVSWLEQQGYDISYVASNDLETAGALTGHRIFLSPSHDEYWSSGMRSAITAARDAGTSLAFLGSNAIYWKIRYAASPVTGAAKRVQVDYKTVAGGPPDPSGDPTSSWRDPNGPNLPENGLLGQMYIGDNDGVTFRYRVSDVQGHDTLWRRTSVANLAAGASATLGTSTVGWEWDARVDNGAEPSNVTTLSGTPVAGELIQNGGANYITGSATSSSTRYQAGSGALVFSSGTNNWSRGLGVNMAGSGEPNSDIQQATANLLVDMGTAPTTPASGIVTEDPTSLNVTDRLPASGATDVLATTAVSAALDLTLAPSTVNASTVTLTGPTGAVAAGVSYDVGSKRITLTPTASLKPASTYTVTLAGSIGTPWGTSLGSPVSWAFTTVAAPVLGVTARTPAPGATGIGQTPSITATFNLSLDPSTVNSANVTLTAPGGPVAATVAYDNATRKITVTPAAALPWNTTYTVSVTTGVQAADGTLLVAPITWAFSTAACPCSLITSTPVKVHLPVKDGRAGSGPFSYELGTKIVATAPAQLVAIRYYRDSSETGTHVGRVWSSTGTLLASVAFTGETSSGWQTQALATPLTLTVGQTYVVSVGINAFFVMTNFGLQTQLSNGPISTDVTLGKNGVIGSAAGVFPTSSYQSSSYFVDAVAQ
jgi:Domain of unknown function (DUF4082)/Bacterial Ig-like domain